MTVRCLIVDELHESIGPMLKSIGVDYDYHPKIAREEIKAILTDYDGLFIRSKTIVDKDLLGNSKLKFIARAGAGIDNLDTRLLASKDIKIFNAPEGNRDSVGEHTIGLILSLLHKINHGHNQILDGVWDREANRGIELGSLTVGVYGCGNSGSSVAKNLSGFGCEVITYDKYLDELAHNNAKLVDQETFFNETDVLTIHIPLTEETERMVNIEFLNQFKKPLIFINTSRGEIAPITALYQGITTNKILMAGLDVLENEKINEMSTDHQIAFDGLKKSDRVIFTPHVAGWTFESYERINAVLVEKIDAFLEGR